MKTLKSVALLSLALTVLSTANAEPMRFQYGFTGQASQPFANGSILTGHFDGTIQPDGDTVIINSFDLVTFERPGLPLFLFPGVDNSEFNSLPSGIAPFLTFTGTTASFRACPNGFTFTTPGSPVPDDCGFGSEGGFGMTYDIFPPDGWISAADGSGATPQCSDPPFGVNGCRSTDTPIDTAAWTVMQLRPNGVVQDFSDGGSPLLGNGQFCTNCLLNGWVGELALDAGEDGVGDHALFYNSGGAGFHVLTWYGYATADTDFLGNYLTSGVLALRFKARHTGIGDSLAMRAFIFDSADLVDGTTDWVISNTTAAIANTDTTWQTYEIPISVADVIAGISFSMGAPKSASDILSAVTQIGLRHDPLGTGPGTPAPVNAQVYFDDIELVLDPDVDNDGIDRFVDTSPFVASDDFDDGTTSGTITSRGDQILTVSEEPDPDGVRISAALGGGPAEATVSVCGGVASLSFSAGDESVATCTSVQLIVITGEVAMQVEVNGEIAVVTVPADNEVTFVPETSTFTAPPTNTETVVVVVDGTEVPIDPGETSIFTEFKKFVASGEFEDDELEIEGFFRLNKSTDGIKPLTEDVTIDVAGQSLTIPAGSFSKDDGEFEFEGYVDGVELEVEFERVRKRKYEFEIEAEDLNAGSGAELTLTIGNDTGTTNIADDDD